MSGIANIGSTSLWPFHDFEETRRKRVTKATLRPRVINVFKNEKKPITFEHKWRRTCQNVLALL